MEWEEGSLLSSKLDWEKKEKEESKEKKGFFTVGLLDFREIVNFDTIASRILIMIYQF